MACPPPPLRPRPITDPERFGATLSDPLAIFNATAQLPTDVVLWPDALRHLTRLSRVLRLTPAQAPPLRSSIGPVGAGGGYGFPDLRTRMRWARIVIKIIKTSIFTFISCFRMVL